MQIDWKKLRLPEEELQEARQTISWLQSNKRMLTISRLVWRKRLLHSDAQSWNIGSCLGLSGGGLGIDANFVSMEEDKAALQSQQREAQDKRAALEEERTQFRTKCVRGLFFQ